MLFIIDNDQGVLGSHGSGKTALVHRYLTGSYLSEESPEGELSYCNISLSAIDFYILLVKCIIA